MSYLLGGGGGGGGAPLNGGGGAPLNGGGGAPLNGGGGGGGGLDPLGGLPEDFAPPESKDGISISFKISYLLLNKQPSSPREEPGLMMTVKQNNTPNTD